jgi:GNAT superfamily N-acetyltransferase
MGPLQFRIPEIRPANLGDGELLDALLDGATRYVLPGFVGPLAGALPIRHLASQDRMLVADGTGYIVSMGDTPLAFGAWSRRDRDPAAAGANGGAAPLLVPGHDAARVMSLAVRRDFTGKGLAAGLLDECAEAARAEGYTALAMMAVPDAVAMAIRSGFDEIERAVLEVDGHAMDAVQMRRRLR